MVTPEQVIDHRLGGLRWQRPGDEVGHVERTRTAVNRLPVDDRCQRSVSGEKEIVESEIAVQDRSRRSVVQPGDTRQSGLPDGLNVSHAVLAQTLRGEAFERTPIVPVLGVEEPRHDVAVDEPVPHLRTRITPTRRMKARQCAERNRRPCWITTSDLISHLGLMEVLKEKNAGWHVGIGLHLSEKGTQQEQGEPLRLDQLFEEGLFLASCFVNRGVSNGSWGVDIGQERVVRPNLSLIDPERLPGGPIQRKGSRNFRNHGRRAGASRVGEAKTSDIADEAFTIAEVSALKGFDSGVCADRTLRAQHLREPVGRDVIEPARCRGRHQAKLAPEPSSGPERSAPEGRQHGVALAVEDEHIGPGRRDEAIGRNGG